MFKSFSVDNSHLFDSSAEENMYLDQVLAQDDMKETIMDYMLIQQQDNDGVRLYSREDLNDKQITER
jgi:hypothetical protein